MPLSPLLRPRLLGLLAALLVPCAALAGPGDAEPTGPVMLLFSPAAADGGPEAAYAAARPFLGSQRPASVQSLDSVTRIDPQALFATVNPVLVCGDRVQQGTLQDTLDQASNAAYGLEPELAAAAARAAQLHLVCGAEAPRLQDATSLVRARAAARWFAGDVSGAAALWEELFTLEPAAPTEADLPPDALAAQLDAKSRAVSAPSVGELAFALAAGWSATIDGAPVDGRAARVAAGERVVRLRGPTGRTLGAVLAIPEDGAVAVGTGAGLASELSRDKPAAAALTWLGAQLDAAATGLGASAALLVDLSATPATVRRFQGGGSLVLSTSRAARVRPTATKTSAAPPVGSIALVGAGVVAAAVGAVLGALAHRDGLALSDSLSTVSGFDSSYRAYEAARTRERIGTGVAIGGGVIAAIGGVTFAIPSPGRGR